MKKSEIRRDKVLKFLVEEYVKSVEPVSSGLISEKYVTESSSATIRIDLSRLEKENLIYQAHTSAGRVPTVKGYRKYLNLIDKDIANYSFPKSDFLRSLLIKNYKDTPLALHYIMQLLAKETDQLSFVAEPEISFGYLEKLDVFKIGNQKLIFVISLDSGLDKTVILKCDYEISEQQLKTIVRYINDRLAGQRIYDIQNNILDDLVENQSSENVVLRQFLEELQNALTEISSYFIHFDGNISFLEQPEFNDKSSILTFLGFIQRQDHLVNLLQKTPGKEFTHILMGEELGQPELANCTLIFAKYEIFGVPGYLGVLGPNRMNYRENIATIRDVAKIITETTKKGVLTVK
ncbi:MAG: heat-inducible transcriptional repressor HrcA [Candidatus Cloacimonadales bacterium]